MLNGLRSYSGGVGRKGGGRGHSLIFSVFLSVFSPKALPSASLKPWCQMERVEWAAKLLWLGWKKGGEGGRGHSLIFSVFHPVSAQNLLLPTWVGESLDPQMKKLNGCKVTLVGLEGRRRRPWPQLRSSHSQSVDQCLPASKQETTTLNICLLNSKQI